MLTWKKAEEELPSELEGCLFRIKDDPYVFWGWYKNKKFVSLDFLYDDGDGYEKYSGTEVDDWISLPETYSPDKPDWIPCIYENGILQNDPEEKVIVGMQYDDDEYEESRKKYIHVGFAYWDRREWRWTMDGMDSIVFNGTEYIKAFMFVPG